MKRYKSTIFERVEDLFGRYNIEFYAKNNTIYVEYNSKSMPFQVFWKKYPEAKTICSEIYNELLYGDKDFLKNLNGLRKELISNKWEQSLLNFIGKYWVKREDPLDAVITDHRTMLNTESMNRYESPFTEQALTSRGVKTKTFGLKAMHIEKMKSDIEAEESTDPNKTCHNCQLGHNINPNWEKCTNTKVRTYITHSNDTCPLWTAEKVDIEDNSFEDNID